MEKIKMMKYIRLILIFIALALFIGCSSDNDNIDTSAENPDDDTIEMPEKNITGVWRIDGIDEDNSGFFENVQAKGWKIGLGKDGTYYSFFLNFLDIGKYNYETDTFLRLHSELNEFELSDITILESTDYTLKAEYYVDHFRRVVTFIAHKE